MADPDPNPITDPDSDRISDLPDSLLLLIINLLPLADSARTTTLSRRFRHLFSLSTLTIDGRIQNRNPESPNPNPNSKIRGRSPAPYLAHVTTLSNLLSRHHGPIHSFLFSPQQWDLILETGPNYNPNWARFKRSLNSWIRILAHRSIRRLNLRHKIPGGVLDCAPSLEFLELMNFRFESLPPIPLNLMELKLSDCELNDEVLGLILAEFRVLESLELWPCRGLVKVRVKSASLKRFKFWVVKFGVGGGERELGVDAPNLQSLVIGENMTSVMRMRVVNCPKLQQLGVLNATVRMIGIGDWSYVHDQAIDLLTCVPSLKTLAIKVNLRNFDEAKYVAACLKSFPCLETLDLLMVNDTVDAPEPRPWNWEQEGSFDCLEQHLKVVRLKGMVGDVYDKQFARYLVQKAKVLRVMSFHNLFTQTIMWRVENLQKVCFENRASFNAQVIYPGDDNHNLEFSTWGGRFLGLNTN